MTDSIMLMATALNLSLQGSAGWRTWHTTINNFTEILSSLTFTTDWLCGRGASLYSLYTRQTTKTVVGIATADTNKQTNLG